MDTNGDGYISVDEFMAACGRVSYLALYKSENSTMFVNMKLHSIDKIRS